MNLTCTKQQLVEAVSNVQRAVSSKSSVPALEGILLKAREGEIFLCGYDLELGITTTIEASVEETGAVILNARLFSDIVRRLPADTVQLTTDEKDVTTIHSGNSEFSIAGIPAAEYPELPVVTDESSIALSHTMMKGMIRQTIFAVAESDAKPIHTGTLFEIGEGVVRLVSVDGYRLAIREEKAADAVEAMNFVVPGKSLGEVLKLLSDDEESKVSLQVGRRHILFNIGRYTLISRLLEGEFLDYRAAIPASASMEVICKTRDFIESVERVSLLITDRMKSPIRCVFDTDEISLSCSTAIGRASDQFTARVSGDPVEIGFNNRFLLDALRNTEGDEVRIQLNGPLSPMKILPREGDAFLFLVLPVRL